MTTATITLIGGPTALIELNGFRLLTDPTFDGPGEERRWTQYLLNYARRPAPIPRTRRIASAE